MKELEVVIEVLRVAIKYQKKALVATMTLLIVLIYAALLKEKVVSYVDAAKRTMHYAMHRFSK